jgi:hypothetical protein
MATSTSFTEVTESPAYKQMLSVLKGEGHKFADVRDDKQWVRLYHLDNTGRIVTLHIVKVNRHGIAAWSVTVWSGSGSNTVADDIDMILSANGFPAFEDTVTYEEYDDLACQITFEYASDYKTLLSVATLDDFEKEWTDDDAVRLHAPSSEALDSLTLILDRMARTAYRESVAR